VKGTPKNLREAIENGVFYQPVGGQGELIEPHVIDYLAQKFGAAMLGTDSLETKKALQLLWEKITGENYADINRRSP
jgi:hypothetical protein